MGTSTPYAYSGRPDRPDNSDQWTPSKPGIEQAVTDYADAIIESARKPSRAQARGAEAIAEQIAAKATDIGIRLVKTVSAHRPPSEMSSPPQEFQAIVDEVFSDAGSDLFDAAIRKAAVRALDHWFTTEFGAAGPDLDFEGGDRDIAGDDLLGEVLTELGLDATVGTDPLELLLDEFHAGLLVELFGLLAEESIFPGIGQLKLLALLWRWAWRRLVGSRSRRNLIGDGGSNTPGRLVQQERQLIDELLDLDEPGDDTPTLPEGM